VAVVVIVVCVGLQLFINSKKTDNEQLLFGTPVELYGRLKTNVNDV
jgi:hypothetical protein